MTVIIEPEFNNMEYLKTPIQPGESVFCERIIEVFNKQTDRNIELYFQANINGARPDIICVEQSNEYRPGGIWIIEVKDWNLNNFTIDKKTWKFDNKHEIKSPLGQVNNYKDLINETIDSPIETVQNIRNDIYNSNLDFFYHKEDEKAANHLVKTAVYFHTDTRKDIYEDHTTIFFKGFTDRKLEEFFESSYATKLTHESYINIKQYLGVMECDFESPPKKLNEKQERIYSSFISEDNRKKFIGPAGTGKTELLAQMIAYELDDGKDVLVLTFNITLINFLHDRIRNTLRKTIPTRRLTISNYHTFFKKSCQKYGLEYKLKEYNDFFDASDNIHFFESKKDKINKFKAVLNNS